MKKKTCVLGVAVLLAALLAFAGVAQSAMWVGAELGGNFVPSSTKLKASAPGFPDISGKADFFASVIGGAIIGYDFVNSGFGAYNWPDWMRYFSVATDITYNRLDVAKLRVENVNFGDPGIKGYCVAWTFLLMAHYGFFPDSEIPTGRVNPYIGVGPTIIWSGLESGNLGAGSATATNIGLVVEPGIRWVAFKNVSIDTAFRWRYAVPSYSFEGADIKINPLNQFSFLVRANYHF